MDLQNQLGPRVTQPETNGIQTRSNFGWKKINIPLRFPKTRVRKYFVLALGVAFASVLLYTISKGHLGFPINPCDDFYEYSCQEWHAKNPRPDWALEWGTFDFISHQTNILVSEIMETPVEELDINALKQAKDFYKKCLNSDNEQDDNSNYSTLNFVWETLESYGGWPVLYENGTWNSNDFSLTKSIVALEKRFNIPVVFEISSVQISPTNSSDNFIFISKPESSISKSREFVTDLLINWIVFLNSLRKSGERLSGLILNLRNELSKLKQIKPANKVNIRSQVNDIIKNIRLFMNPAKNSRSRDIQIMYGFFQKGDQIKIKTLQKMVDVAVGGKNKVNFRSLLEHVYEDVGIEIEENINLFVPDIEYVLDISTILHELPDESLANFLHFFMAFQMASFGTGSLRRSYDEWSNELHYKDRDRPPRSKICSEEVQDKFKFAVAYKLAKQTYNDMDQFKTIQNEVQNIFDNVKSSILKHSIILERRPWSIDVCIGFPEYIFDVNAVQNEYIKLHLYSNQSYLEQTLILNTWAANNALELLKYPLDNKCRWKRFPGQVIPFVRIDQLLVYLPMGLLQPPFFDINRPTAVNYGYLGALIGHELGHAFLHSGLLIYRDKPRSIIENCLRKQYNNYVGNEADIVTNGDYTVSENFADNIGLREAYSAFLGLAQKDFQRNIEYTEYTNETKLKSERSFFLSFGQIWCVAYSPRGLKDRIKQGKHSPGTYRALETLRNSKQFKTAWNCQAGSKMSSFKIGQQNCEIP